MKNRIKLTFFALVTLYPFVVGYTPPDPGNWTIVDLILGFGSYYQVLARDCNGNITRAQDHPLNEWGLTLRHHMKDFVVEGRVGSVTSDGIGPLLTETRNTSPSNPSTMFVGAGVGLDGDGGALKVGILYFTNPIELLNSNPNIKPYGSIRLGNERKFHFSIGILDNPTIMTSGGLFDLGVGFPLDPDGVSKFWFGIGGGIYNDAQIIARLVITPKDQPFSILLNGNTGLGQSPTPNSTYGLSGGLRWKF